MGLWNYVRKLVARIYTWQVKVNDKDIFAIIRIYTRTHDTLSTTAFVAQLAERRTRFAVSWVQFSPKALELHFSQLVFVESYTLAKYPDRLPLPDIECKMPILVLMFPIYFHRDHYYLHVY